MKYKLIISSLVLTLTFLSYAHAQKVDDATTMSTADLMGRLDGRIYKNRLLRFELTLPDGGTILNRAEIDIYKDAGTDILKKGENRDQIAAGKKIEAAVDKEVTLLTYADQPIGSPKNAFLVISVQKQPKGISDSMSLASTLRVLTATGKFELVKSLKDFEIGGQKVKGLEGNLIVPGGAKLRERIFLIIRDGYGIAFTLGVLGDADFESAQSLLDGLRFIK